MLSEQDKRSLRVLVGRFIRPYWKAIVFFSALNVVAGILVSVRPLVLAPALDLLVSASSEAAQSWSDLSLNNLGVTILSLFGFTREDTGSISILVMVLFVLVSVVIAAVSFAAFTGNQKVRASIYRDMTVAVHRHLLRLSLAYFNSKKSGELVGRLTNDIRATVNFMDSAPRELLRSCSRLAISLTILIGTNAVLTLWILLLGMTHFLITQITVRRVKREVKRYFAQFAKVNATLFESVTMIRLVKSFGAEVHDAERVARDSDQMRRYSIAFAMSRYYQEPMRLVLDAALAGAILWLAFDAIGDGTLSVQAALLFFYLAQQTIDPIAMLSRQLFGMHQTLAGASNVVEILEETTTLPDGGISPPALKDSIQFRGVSYAYLQGEEVLQDIDLEIKRGEMVALVGPSGAGKSTLADLVLRFDDPTKGAILYDGTDIREFRQREYRRRFGVVAQESLLFNDTLLNNILFDKDYSEEKLQRAIDIANAREFIDKLPEGLETLVGDRGVRLSGGQKQRVAIARAVYHHPEILVLDEATSSLDTESERAVQEAIDRVVAEMTAIVIAHRLSTILHADKIVVLNEGRIEAAGSHREVLQRSATYKRLYELQFALNLDMSEKERTLA